ncbi:MAG TPA: hypothetical protein VEF06_06435 [Bryobacteraceae bacterium]|nr:hypothetical protein [Bryobacteraceae bacterium]
MTHQTQPDACAIVIGYDGAKMSIAPLPATLEHLSGRRFSFYPPIRNIGRNEWLYRRATWSECVVVNLGTGEEFAIPRMFMGDASILDEPAPGEPATVVELHLELEWRAGSILPSERRVIELPVAVEPEEAFEAHPQTGHRAPVINIRLEPKSEPGAGKWIGVAMVLGAVACAIVAGITVQSGRRADINTVSRAWLELSQDDDYQAVLKKLGPPAREHSFERNGTALRVLVYPGLRFSVVLRGRSVPAAHYAETIDLRGHVLGSDGPPLTLF